MLLLDVVYLIVMPSYFILYSIGLGKQIKTRRKFESLPAFLQLGSYKYIVRWMPDHVASIEFKRIKTTFHFSKRLHNSDWNGNYIVG